MAGIKDIADRRNSGWHNAALGKIHSGKVNFNVIIVRRFGRFSGNRRRGHRRDQVRGLIDIQFGRYRNHFRNPVIIRIKFKLRCLVRTDGKASLRPSFDRHVIEHRHRFHAVRAYFFIDQSECPAIGRRQAALQIDVILFAGITGQENILMAVGTVKICAWDFFVQIAVRVITHLIAVLVGDKNIHRAMKFDLVAEYLASAFIRRQSIVIDHVMKLSQVITGDDAGDFFLDAGETGHIAVAMFDNRYQRIGKDRVEFVAIVGFYAVRTFKRHRIVAGDP